jgi:peptide/nickel transport system permease protein
MMVISFFVVVTVLFFLFRSVPGGPFSYLTATGVPDEVRQQILESYGLNEPLWKQYLLYVWNILHGEFGRSFYYSAPVLSIVLDRLVNTLSLMLTAIVLSYGVGTYLGVQFAWIRGTKLERVGMVGVLLLRSMPVFWTAIMLLFVFSFQLDLFPLGGVRDVSASYSGTLDKYASVDFLHHLVLPVLSIAIFYMGFPLLLMRNNLLEVLSEDYITTAKAKGLSDRRVKINHAARNAMLPIITALAIEFGYAIGGQVLIETVFAWPGIGRTMVEAALRKDYPLAQATFIILAMIVIVMNFVSDLTYSYVDPRVRLGEEEG